MVEATVPDQPDDRRILAKPNAIFCLQPRNRPRCRAPSWRSRRRLGNRKRR